MAAAPLGSAPSAGAGDASAGGPADVGPGAELPYLGSQISLISNTEIRYEGILHSINAEQATVTLRMVRSLGTEGRRHPEDIPPSPQVYDCIVFKGSDIKDLTVCSEPDPSLVSHLSSFPPDPAIVSVSGPANAGGYGSAPLSSPEAMYMDPAGGVGRGAGARPAGTVPSPSLMGATPHQGLLPANPAAFHGAGAGLEPSVPGASAGPRGGSAGATPSPGLLGSASSPLLGGEHHPPLLGAAGAPSSGGFPAYPATGAAEGHRDAGAGYVPSPAGQNGRRGPQNMHFGALNGEGTGLKGGRDDGAFAAQQNPGYGRGGAAGRTGRGGFRGPKGQQGGGRGFYSNGGARGRSGSGSYGGFYGGGGRKNGYYGNNYAPGAGPAGGAEGQGRRGYYQRTPIGELKSHPNAQLKSETAEDFDFETMNKQFAKPTSLPPEERQQMEAGEGAGESAEESGSAEKKKPYDKNESFFDSISCEALDKQQGREERFDRQKQRQLDVSTFGSQAAHYRPMQGWGGVGVGRRGGRRGRGGRGRSGTHMSEGM
ncbi:FFD and TFG box motifs protein [Besnoitia besnoiti]|uniref:FFD and TFG box motifs protein n=1 Tax=Besnoitia besnoiti TaxID=94643 RepID=A0A2A9MJ27_BESBE|nr:FFD and TFG box motifs protein [Besnoitia besnoiti]PFH35653.1 FFD and TFG box motifs protein [Besnoitia besnoiti]